MAKQQDKTPRPRITSYIRNTYGEEILQEIISGKRKITLNDTQLDASAKNFRDKRVTPFSQISITPEPTAVKQSSKTPSKPAPKSSEKRIESKTLGATFVKEKKGFHIEPLDEKPEQKTVKEFPPTFPKLKTIEDEPSSKDSEDYTGVEEEENEDEPEEVMKEIEKRGTFTDKTSQMSGGPLSTQDDHTHEDLELDPSQKALVSDFLSEKDIASVQNQRANVFIDGSRTTLDTSIETDDSSPIKNGKPVKITVLPKFSGG
jgi:hypothetical protein